MKVFMPKRPGFFVEDTRRRILQDPMERRLAKRFHSGPDVFPISVCHNLRQKSHLVLQPLLRLTPPENLPGDRQQL